MPFSASQPSPSESALAEWEIALIAHEVQVFVDDHRRLFPYPAEQDLTHDCLLHWLEARPQFAARDGASLRTYLKSVVAKQLIDVLRHEGTVLPQRLRHAQSLERSRIADDDGADTVGDRLADDTADADPAQVLVDRALLAEIAQVRATLTPAEDELLAAMVEERTLADMARRLGRHPNTVKYQRDRLRAKLRGSTLADFL